MNLKTYFMLLPQFLILFPAALLCYLPMKGQLTFSPVRTAVLCLGIWIPYAALAALLCLITGLDVNLVLFPSLLLFFLFYRHTVCSGLSCVLSIFVGVCTLMTFPSHFGYALDAWLYPASGSASFSMWAALFQLGLSCLLTAALAVPCSKHYSRMVRQLSFPQVWYPLLVVQSIFFLFNILMIPHSYQTLYTGRVFSMFLALEIVMFVLFLLIQIIFYHLADTLLEHTKLMERSRILEMEADQYRTLQNYMQQTRRLRHDFRQSVHILSALAEAGNLPDLKAHLQEYEQRWSIETPVNYCSNASLNALFNYYKGIADSDGVDTNWQLRIPEPLTISELDLVSLRRLAYPAPRAAPLRPVCRSPSGELHVHRLDKQLRRTHQKSPRRLPFHQTWPGRNRPVLHHRHRRKILRQRTVHKFREGIFCGCDVENLNIFTR